MVYKILFRIKKTPLLPLFLCLLLSFAVFILGCAGNDRIALEGEIIFGPMYNYNVYKIDLGTLKKEIFYSFDMKYSINKRFREIRHTITGFFFGEDFIIYNTLSDIYIYSSTGKTSELLCKGEKFIFLEETNTLVYYFYKEGLKMVNLIDRNIKTIQKLENSAKVVSGQFVVRKEMGNAVKITGCSIAYHNIKEGSIFIYDVKTEELTNTGIHIGKRDFLQTYCDYNDSFLISSENDGHYFVDLINKKKTKIGFSKRCGKFTYLKDLNGCFFLKSPFMGFITGKTDLYFWDLGTDNKYLIAKGCVIDNIYYHRNGLQYSGD